MGRERGGPSVSERTCDTRPVCALVIRVSVSIRVRVRVRVSIRVSASVRARVRVDGV